MKILRQRFEYLSVFIIFFLLHLTVLEAQIVKVVADTDGGIKKAGVELWDSYPDGRILQKIKSDKNGVFNLPDVSYDSADSVAAGGSTWAGEYNPSNVNNMESYSHLEYDIIDLNLSASYAITDTIGVTLSYVYEDVDDDQAEYVYGDEDGTYQSLVTYLTVRF